MADELVLVVHGEVIGRLTRARGARLELVYDEEWVQRSTATPVSSSMPLGERRFEHDRVAPYLWGLLPDNDRVLERWGRELQVSAADPFALLSRVGEDCAGAVQYVRPERLHDLGPGGIEPLTTAQIAALIRGLRDDPTDWNGQVGPGWFSLAGAQAKTALHRSPDGWARPFGAVPTTHIVKPAITGFDDHDLNEHLCLAAARSVGLLAARSQIERFDDERAVVVERYDRTVAAQVLMRVHQEDLCQALGLHPTMKYEADGGPSVAAMAALLREELPRRAADREVRRLIDAVLFSWLTGGTDAHAKNHSLLLSGAEVRLAPIYDVASALAYEQLHPSKLKLAMRVGGEYRLTRISGRHWRRLAEDVGLDGDGVHVRARELAERVPDAFADASHQREVTALGDDLPQVMTARIADHVEACVRRLDE